MVAPGEATALREGAAGSVERGAGSKSDRSAGLGADPLASLKLVHHGLTSASVSLHLGAKPVDRFGRIRFASGTGLFQPEELSAFTTALTRESLLERTFKEDVDSCGPSFNPWQLASTMHRVEFWREILELSLYKRSLRDLVIKGEAGIKALEEIDTFYARVTAEGSELLLNLALSELFHLSSSHSGISPLVRAQCQGIMRSAVGAAQREYSYHPATQRFVGPENREVDVEPLIPFASRFKAELRSMSGDTLTKRERKLLAAFRVIGREAGRLKQEIALLRAVADAEDQTPPRAVDAALDKVAGVTEHLSDIEPNRLALRYYLHRRLRMALKDLARGLNAAHHTVRGPRSQCSEWIREAQLSYVERAKLGYLHLRHGEYGGLLTKIAVGQSILMLAVGFTQYVGRSFPQILEVLRGAPVGGVLFRFAEHPLTKMGATLLLLGALDLLPNMIIKWQAGKLGRFLAFSRKVPDG